MNKPNESMPLSSAEQPEKAPQMELSMNEKVAEYLRDDYYYEEQYGKYLADAIKEKYPKLDPEIANRLAANVAGAIRYEVSDFLPRKIFDQPLPIYKYHSLLRSALNYFFAKESYQVIAAFEEEKPNIPEKDREASMIDPETQYEAAFDRFFGPLIHYNELESGLHDNNIKKMELSRENQKLPVKNLDRRDQKRKQEINDELIKLAKERKHLEAAKKDAKMLANFLPGYEMNLQEAKKKTEKTGEAFEEDKFTDSWLEKNAVVKVAQLKRKLIEEPKKKSEKRWVKWAKENGQEK